MKPTTPLLFSLGCGVAIAGCSGGVGDGVLGCGDLRACASGPSEAGCPCISIDAATVDAPADARQDGAADALAVDAGAEGAPSDAFAADAGAEGAPFDAFAADAVAGDAPSDASVVDVPAGDAGSSSTPLVDASPADAAAGVPDASPDAALGCYLQGYVYCPVDTWCPLGTCPDGMTPYGCRCSPDGTTICTLDCPN